MVQQVPINSWENDYATKRPNAHSLPRDDLFQAAQIPDEENPVGIDKILEGQ